MMSREELVRVTDPLLIDIAGMVRKWLVTLTNSPIWQLLGLELPDGEGGTFKEVITAEVFSGIGAYARPPSDGTPEAFTVAQNGDPNSHAIIATRDEKTRAAVVQKMGGIDEDERIVFNSSTIVYNRKNGTVEIRTPSGRAVRLATFDDMQANSDYLKKQFDTKTGHTHLSTTPGNPTGPAIEATAPGTTSTVPTPTGTKVLKGE